MPAPRITITVLFDNVAGRPDLDPAHGFSCLIEGGAETVMFDTGSDSHILLENMKKLGKDPRAIDTVVISHPHWDHAGGLFGLMHATGITPRVVMPKAMYEEYVGHVRKLGAVADIVDGPRPIGPGMHSTGQLPAPTGEEDRNEHALILAAPDGPAVVTGCAHPGIVALTRKAIEVVGGKPSLVLGGFHLRHDGPDAVDSVIGELRALGVRAVGTSHCTGAVHAARFRDAWGDGFRPFSCGSVVELAGSAA